MTSDTSPRPISRLRARMIEDMTVRGFNEHTRRDYVRQVRSFAAFIDRSPDTATAEDLRLFQLHQTRIGMQPPSINSAVSALRFFFTVTLDRPDLARRLTVVPYPRRIPAVLSVEEVTLLLRAAMSIKARRSMLSAIARCISGSVKGGLSRLISRWRLMPPGVTAQIAAGARLVMSFISGIVVAIQSVFPAMKARFAVDMSRMIVNSMPSRLGRPLF